MGLGQGGGSPFLPSLGDADASGSGLMFEDHCCRQAELLRIGDWKLLGQ